MRSSSNFAIVKVFEVWRKKWGMTPRIWRAPSLVPCLFAIGIVGLCSVIAKPTQAQEEQRTQTGRQTVPPIDYAVYQNVDDCLAMFHRLDDSIQISIARDTLPWTISELGETFSPSIKTAVSRCGEKFQATTVPLKDWYYVIQIFLISDRDADVKTLIERRLASISKSDTAAVRERARVLDSLVTIYLTIPRPLRFATADSIDHYLTTFPKTVETWYERMSRANGILWRGHRLRDTTNVTRRAAERVVAIGETLTEADRRTSEFNEYGKTMIMGALRHLEREAALDSVRLGRMDGYYAMWKLLWARVTKEHPNAMPIPIGNTAPQLVGQWFNGDGQPISGPIQRPTKGKVSLVVFYNGGSWAFDPHNWGTYATLRRLKAKFPELEINLVAVVPPVWFGPRAKTEPTAEGAMYGKWLAGFHKLPGDVVVETPGFWRLPGLDRRAILHKTTNPYAYRGKVGYDNGSMAQAEGFLIDRSGRIADWRTDGVYRESEPDLEIMIEALLRHPVPTSTASSTTDTGTRTGEP